MIKLLGDHDWGCEPEGADKEQDLYRAHVANDMCSNTDLGMQGYILEPTSHLQREH